MEWMNHVSERKQKRMRCAVQEEVVFDDDEREHIFNGDEYSVDQGDNGSMVGI